MGTGAGGVRACSSNATPRKQLRDTPFTSGMGPGWSANHPTLAWGRQCASLARRVQCIVGGRPPHHARSGTAAVLPREILRQIRRLQLKARRAVEDLLGGEYHSVFKG